MTVDLDWDVVKANLRRLTLESQVEIFLILSGLLMTASDEDLDKAFAASRKEIDAR